MKERSTTVFSSPGYQSEPQPSARRERMKKTPGYRFGYYVLAATLGIITLIKAIF